MQIQATVQLLLMQQGCFQRDFNISLIITRINKVT